MSETTASNTLMQSLRDAGAGHVDAVGWHYIEVLAKRTQSQSGPAQALLREKLLHALQAFEVRVTAHRAVATSDPVPAAEPSPMATLLQDMAPPIQDAPVRAAIDPFGTHRESPRVRQFRKQLRQISMQKRVSKAMARAPQNAGPINSHMLVLRALGLMRDISPDYLNRFMTHVDTLLCLEEANRLRTAPKKTASGQKPRAASIGHQ